MARSRIAAALTLPMLQRIMLAGCGPIR